MDVGLETLLDRFGHLMATSTAFKLTVYVFAAFLASVVINVLRQMLPRKKSEPPLVFHWVPFIGNAVAYGKDPYQFYVNCREKHGDIFTFVLLGKKMTVYLGTTGNEFILNGKLRDVCAEEIYSPLCTPVFGRDIIYDCPNSKLMEQKKFVKFGLTQESLESYVPIIEKEVLDYVKVTPAFKGKEGEVDITEAMAQITLFTAGRALQGAEVRRKLTAEFAGLYHDLDKGFRPINFVMPWAPLPQNRRRDAAHATMSDVYLDIIRRRRKLGGRPEGDDPDMLWHLMDCSYKSGQRVPDTEAAHLMITMLLGGQHSSASSGAWIMLRLASRPDVQEDLYREQVENLGFDGTARGFEYGDIDKLPLLQMVVKETLRVHSSIHTIMRKVKTPMPVPGTDYVVAADKVLVASPLVTHLDEKHFPNAAKWDPYRWMDTKVEEEVEEDFVDYGYGRVNKGTRSPYLPFGAGRHRCIGEKFAYVNLCTIVGSLVREFRFRTMDGGDWVPPTDYASLFSKPMNTDIRWERRIARAS